MERAGFRVCFALLILALVLAGSAAAQACSTCEECENELSVEEAVVYLSSDITASGDCISIGTNRTVLDCSGFTLTGPGSSIGVSVREAESVTIRNCVIRSFSTAVRLEEAKDVTLQNCDLEHDGARGDSLYVRGTAREHYDHAITGVTVDRRPLVYIFEQNGVTAGSDDDGLVIIAFSDSVNIRDINLSYRDGLRLYHSSSPVVENVIVQGGKSTGIAAYMSPSGTFTNNRIEGCAKKGLHLDSSPGSTLRGNVLEDSGEMNLKVSGLSCEDYQQDIDTSNMIGGKEVRYYYNVSGTIAGVEAGHFSAYCSSWLEISDVTVGGDPLYLFRVNGSVITGVSSSMGIEMRESSGNNLSYSSVSSEGHGISLVNSDQNSISWNNITGAGSKGLYVYVSDNNTVEGNIIKQAQEGLVLDQSKDNRVMENNISECRESGIEVICSQRNVVWGCNSSYNKLGLRLTDCPNITIESNTFFGNEEEGIRVEGQDELTLYRIWHNNIFGNKGGNPQARSDYSLDMYFRHQGNYWGRDSLPAFVAGVESNRLDVVDLFPYWKPYGWLTLPVVTELSIGPQYVKAGQDISCSFFISDQDNESLSVNVTWRHNGEPALNETVEVDNGTWASSLHPAGSHHKGEAWSCSAQPYDGEEWGYEINSSNVTVVNSRPSTPSLLLPPPNAVLGDSNVTFNFISTDDDDDEITYYVFLDNKLIATTALNYTYHTVTDGEHEWSVKASDSEANSTRSEDRNLTVDTGAGGVGRPGGSGGDGLGDGGEALEIMAPDEISMKQNEVKTYSISVKNPTSRNITVFLVASSNCPGCLLRVDPKSTIAESSKSVMFQLTVTVSISEPAGEYRIWLQALEGDTEMAKKGVNLRVSELPLICAEGQSKCDGDRVVVCNPYRTGWVERESCQYGCDKARCKSEPQLCTPNEVVCDGNTVKTCNSRGNAWISTQECIFGCENNQCVAGLDPSVIWIPLVITVTIISSLVAVLYFKARAKRKRQEQEKEWRRLESKYSEVE